MTSILLDVSGRCLMTNIQHTRKTTHLETTKRNENNFLWVMCFLSFFLIYSFAQDSKPFQLSTGEAERETRRAPPPLPPARLP